MIYQASDVLVVNELDMTSNSSCDAFDFDSDADSDFDICFIEKR